MKLCDVAFDNIDNIIKLNLIVRSHSSNVKLCKVTLLQKWYPFGFLLSSRHHSLVNFHNNDRM